MLKMIVTDAVVSKGYNGAPAIRFYDGENGTQIANFKVGKRVYDAKAEDKRRWVNLNVKAFGDMCERLKRMKLKDGSYVSLVARYDEEAWEDKNTHETRTAPILILDEIEYSGGGGQKSGQNNAGSVPASADAGQEEPPAGGAPQQSSGEMPDGFTGYEPFGSGNGFF